MLRRAFFIVAAFALAACGTSDGTPKTAKDPGLALPAGMNEPPPPEEAVVYACENGASFKAVFSDNNGTVRIEPQGSTPYTLYIAATGSGFAYMDGGHELRGKGDEAMWTDEKKPVTKCTATPVG